MVVREFIDKATSRGWRALVVYIGSIDRLAEILNGEKVELELCILRSPDLPVDCRVRKTYRDTHRLLGAEYGNVFFSLEKTMGWPGNLLALSFEFVSRGGYYILHVSPTHYNRVFTRYFINVVKRNCNVLVVKDGEIIYQSICGGKPVEVSKLEPRSSDRVIRKLEKLCVNEEQARIVRGYPGFLYGRDKLFLIHGDRGRGKSSVMGLLASYTMFKGRGRFIVTSHSIFGVQSFYKMLIRGLEALGEKPVVIERNGLVYGVSIGKASIEYREPWRIAGVPQPPLFVDEAAGVGVARVRRWYNRIGKLVASTTIHGYEGSGRVLLKMIRELFHKTQVYKLEKPIRYYPGDPLERILYSVFHLDAEPLEKDRVVEPLRIETYSSKDLAVDYELLRKVYGLLVTAHYRNEPDDLILMLDTDLFTYYVVYDGEDDVVAVAQTRVEQVDSINPEDLAGKGYRLVDKFSRYTLLEELLGKRIIRIVRIAVTPPLQRRGIGSKLLKYVEEHARNTGFDGVGAIFSGFDTIRFWIKNDYLPIYVSPRYNRVTGEKNVVVIKPLNNELKRVVDKAVNMFYHYMWFTSHILYRDLGSEKLSMIMRYLQSRGYNGFVEKKYLVKRLENALKDKLPVDAVLDILVERQDMIEHATLDDVQHLVFTARILQGKTLADIARITRMKPDKVAEVYEDTIKTLLEKLYKELVSEH